MSEERPLPRSWARDFEGKSSARYRRDPVGVEVVIEPRYTVTSGRPEQKPSTFRVQLRRPFWQGDNRVKTPLTNCDSFEEAKDIAYSYMEAYNERYRRVHDEGDEVLTQGGDNDRIRTASAVAIDATIETIAYSDDLLLDHLESLLGDGLRAVWHADPTGIDRVYRAEHTELDGERMREVADVLGTLERDALADTLRDEINCVSITMAEHVLYQFVLETGTSTFILVDETQKIEHPNFVRETGALLAERQIE